MARKAKEGVEVIEGAAPARPRVLKGGDAEPAAVDSPLAKGKAIARRLEGEDPEAEREDDRESAGARPRRGARREPGMAVESDGPATGGDAPLFDSGPEIHSRVYRRKGLLIVEFDEPTKKVVFNKRQCKNLTGHMAVEARELPVVNRTGDEDPDEIDMGADIKLAQGGVLMTFPEMTRKWEMTKKAAELVIGEINAKARVLPSKSAG